MMHEFLNSAPEAWVLRFGARMVLMNQKAGSVAAPPPSWPPDRRSGRSPAWPCLPSGSSERPRV